MKGNSAFTPARSRISAKIVSRSCCASGAMLMGMATIVCGLAASGESAWRESIPVAIAPVLTTPSWMNFRRFMRGSMTTKSKSKMKKNAVLIEFGFRFQIVWRLQLDQRRDVAVGSQDVVGAVVFEFDDLDAAAPEIGRTVGHGAGAGLHEIKQPCAVARKNDVRMMAHAGVVGSGAGDLE